MNKLYRNPAAWLVVFIFVSLLLEFFWNYPRLASGLFGTLGILLIVGHLRATARFRKLGYRIVWYGRDAFCYDEFAGREKRRLGIYCELQNRGPRRLYLPGSGEWQQTMPDWAGSRRAEIIDRIRDELRAKHVQYIDAESDLA